MWKQTEIILNEYPRGFHIITNFIEEGIPELEQISTGIMHIFILHTSAAITINENADPTVRDDLESHFNKMIPENEPHYRHTIEGPDDMPAHLKSSILGSSLSIPIKNGTIALGTWQGIYLCEHRNWGGKRKLIVTINGE